MLISCVITGVIVQKVGHSVIINPEFGFQFRRDRIRQMVEAVPEMIEQSRHADLIFVVGTSEIESGFDPIAFDKSYEKESRRKSVSWNLGLRGRGYELDRMQSEIIMRVARDRKPSLIFNQISLARTTTRLLDHDLEATITDDFSIYFDRSFGRRMGFQRVSEAKFSNWVNIQVMETLGLDTTWAMNFYGVQSWLRELLMPTEEGGNVLPWRDLRLHVRPAFEVKSRGLFNWSLPDSAEAYARHAANQTNVFVRRRIQRFFLNCCFGGDIELNEEALANQVREAHQLQRELQVPVIHLLLPVRRSGYESLPIDPLFAEFKAMWKPEWGELLDLSDDQELGKQENFFDVVHFQRAGQELLARRIASRAKLLMEGGRSAAESNPSQSK
jgi:hypothetical protein